MARFVAACEADDPAFFGSAGERERWLAADVDALAASRLNNLTEPDLERDAVAAIQAQTLIYVGTLDNPEPKEQAVHLLPNASFVALDGLSHAQAQNRGDLVLPYALAFLAGLAGSSSWPS